MEDEQQKPEGIGKIFMIFLRLGLTSFGGPVAHLGFFREEFVSRRAWLNEASFADLVALCQFLPGPASSQVGLAIGLTRRGYLGAVAAWTGFTMPSALVLICFALGVSSYGDSIPLGALQGLKVAAVAVVGKALWGMGQKLCPDLQRLVIMAVSASVILFVPQALTPIFVILAAGILGLIICPAQAKDKSSALKVPVSRRSGLIAFALFFLLLFGLPLARASFENQSLALIDSFYRSGSLVFGGGHVVLPLLQAEVVSQGWVHKEAFMAGYGATQAVPGPVFTFSAFLGASMNQAPSAWAGGFICLMAIFLPSFLLVAGAMPFWESLRQHHRTQKALAGINAAVVGILLAALYDPVFSTGVVDKRDFALAVLAFVGLQAAKWPSWLVVLLCGCGGSVLALI